jgi:hypothetical protein
LEAFLTALNSAVAPKRLNIFSESIGNKCYTLLMEKLAPNSIYESRTGLPFLVPNFSVNAFLLCISRASSLFNKNKKGVKGFFHDLLIKIMTSRSNNSNDGFCLYMLIMATSG